MKYNNNKNNNNNNSIFNLLLHQIPISMELYKTKYRNLTKTAVVRKHI